MKLRIAIAGVGALASVSVFANGSASPGFVKIKPSHSNLCLNSMDKRLDSGATIVQWSCSDQDTQRFSVTQNSDGFYSIKSKGSNLCFGVPYAWQGKTGVTLYQVPCGLYSRQSNEFIVTEQSDNLYTISPARAPKTCLGVTYSSVDMFASVVQEPCTLSANQLFAFVAE